MSSRASLVMVALLAVNNTKGKAIEYDFADLEVNGQYQDPRYSMTVVDDRKHLDELVKSRVDFKDRLKRVLERSQPQGQSL